MTDQSSRKIGHPTWTKPLLTENNIWLWAPDGTTPRQIDWLSIETVFGFDIRCPVIKTALSDTTELVSPTPHLGKETSSFQEVVLLRIQEDGYIKKNQQSLLTHYIHSVIVSSGSLTPPGTWSRDCPRRRMIQALCIQLKIPVHDTCCKRVLHSQHRPEEELWHLYKQLKNAIAQSSFLFDRTDRHNT